MQIPDALAKLAVQAQTDVDAIPVLHDLMLELGWSRHPHIMPLCLGIELTQNPDYSLARSREEWDRIFERDLAHAQSEWDNYAGRHPSWARAVLAALLFGAWAPSMRRTPSPYGTRSPWRLIRHHAALRRELFETRITFSSNADLRNFEVGTLIEFSNADGMPRERTSDTVDAIAYANRAMGIRSR